jgi:hypothetical protein
MNSENCKILSAPTYLKFDFRECYINQCKLKNIIPSSSSLASQNDPGKLKIYADRIKLCDWEALLSVLNIENSLKEICIYSKKTKRDWPQCGMYSNAVLFLKILIQIKYTVCMYIQYIVYSTCTVCIK